MSRVCENKEFALTCPTTKLIHVTSAFYGKSDESSSSPVNCDSSGAICGSESAAIDALGAVRDMCDGASQCMFNVSGDVFGGDPCTGVVKFADIEWTCLASGERQPFIGSLFLCVLYQVQ